MNCPYLPARILAEPWRGAEARLEAARNSLIPFACYVDPQAAGWYRAKHLQKAAEYFEAVERGEIRRLIINWPPRHWKTSLIEKFCAWYLGRHPEKSIILASYAESLPLRSSRYVRETIETNPRYAALFPQTHTRQDSRDVTDWATTRAHRSSFRAVGVGGGITGMGADVIIVDDPIKDWADAQSEVIREKTWDWLTKTLYQRQEPNAAIIQSMTRWHENDPTGRLLRAESEIGTEHWEHVRFPARAEGDPAPQSVAVSATDPAGRRGDPLGRKPGATLWPERFAESHYSEAERFSGPAAWDLTWQQKDAKAEGFEIKREWFADNFFAQLPSDAKWAVRWWDFALTEKETQKSDPDFHASVKACAYRGDLWLGKPVLLRCHWTDAVTQVMAHAMDEGWGEVTSPLRLGTGKSYADSLALKDLRAKGFAITGYDEKGDKYARAQPWINLARLRRVKLVGTLSEWEPFMAQWLKFPHGAHDDSVDAVSGAAQMLGFVFDPAPRELRGVRREDPYRKIYYK